MTTTRVLFICETTTTATGAGVREVWEPSESELAELGYQRVPATIPPPNGHEADDGPVFSNEWLDPGNEEFRKSGILKSLTAAPDMRAALLSSAGEQVNGHGVVRPCPVHGVRPFSLCSQCRAWSEREATR